MTTSRPRRSTTSSRTTSPRSSTTATPPACRRAGSTMMTHTLKTLGPKVLASRMVQDYTVQLYSPAAGAGRSVAGSEFAGAKDLAAYKAKVRAAWPKVKVEHVEPSGVSDSPQIGDALDVRPTSTLGRPDARRRRGAARPRPRQRRRRDLGHGGRPARASSSPTTDGRHQFAGSQPLRRTGSFGYSVRVVPEAPRRSPARPSWVWRATPEARRPRARTHGVRALVRRAEDVAGAGGPSAQHRGRAPDAHRRGQHRDGSPRRRDRPGERGGRRRCPRAARMPSRPAPWAA